MTASSISRESTVDTLNVNLNCLVASGCYPVVAGAVDAEDIQLQVFRDAEE